jgi:hypothetical protein
MRAELWKYQGLDIDSDGMVKQALNDAEAFLDDENPFVIFSEIHVPTRMRCAQIPHTASTYRNLICWCNHLLTESDLAASKTGPSSSPTNDTGK